jgi:hypothetical protein
VPEEPSPFALWVKNRLRQGQPVVELGFGTGRDSLWFARNGHPVIAYDFAETAVNMATRKIDSDTSATATFDTLNLADSTATGDMSRHISTVAESPALYARFLLHSLESVGRANLLDMAAYVLSEGGELDLEFRTGHDSDTKHLFGEDHMRVYLDPDGIIDEIITRGGKITHFEAGRGLARFKGEDPHVARIVARWGA